MEKIKGIKNVNDVRPTIVIDTREQTPLHFVRLQSEAGTLTSGDYSVLGLENYFAVERKTLPDFISCCKGENRARFERELHRLRGYSFARVIVTASFDDLKGGNYRSNFKPKSAINTISAFEGRYNIPFVFFDTDNAAAEKIESWAYWFLREQIKNINFFYQQNKKQ